MRHLEAVPTSSLTQSHLFCPLHMNNYVQGFLGINKKEKNQAGKLEGTAFQIHFNAIQLTHIHYNVSNLTADETTKNNSPSNHGGKSLTPKYLSGFPLKVMTRAFTLKPVNIDYAGLTLVLRCSIYTQYGLYFKIEINHDFYIICILVGDMGRCLLLK